MGFSERSANIQSRGNVSQRHRQEPRAKSQEPRAKSQEPREEPRDYPSEILGIGVPVTAALSSVIGTPYFLGARWAGSSGMKGLASRINADVFDPFQNEPVVIQYPAAQDSLETWLPHHDERISPRQDNGAGISIPTSLLILTSHEKSLAALASILGFFDFHSWQPPLFVQDEVAVVSLNPAIFSHSSSTWMRFSERSEEKQFARHEHVEFTTPLQIDSKLGYIVVPQMVGYCVSPSHSRSPTHIHFPGLLISYDLEARTLECRILCKQTFT